MTFDCLDRVMATQGPVQGPVLDLRRLEKRAEFIRRNENSNQVHGLDADQKLDAVPFRCFGFKRAEFIRRNQNNKQVGARPLHGE